MNLYTLFIGNKSLIYDFFAILFSSSLLFLFIIFIIKNKISQDKINIQQIHTGNSTRYGGIVFVIIFIGIVFFKNNLENNFTFLIILYGLPFIFFTLLEDLFQNINPSIRLITLLISSFLMCSLGLKNLPIIEIPFIDNFINSPTISILFYTIALTAYINGVNFIDGTNGLAGFSILVSTLCLLFLSLLTQDIYIAKITIFLIAIILSFLIFNFPFGKIFLGDLGAYFLGWTVGSVTIFFMSRNPDVLNWCAVIILSYPITEVVFSVIRKIYESKNPTYPDRQHLHLKLFFTLNKKISDKTAANSLVTPFLSLIWLTPLVLIPWIYDNKILIILSVFLQAFIYFSFYAIIPAEKKDW